MIRVSLLIGLKGWEGGAVRRGDRKNEGQEGCLRRWNTGRDTSKWNKNVS